MTECSAAAMMLCGFNSLELERDVRFIFVQSDSKINQNSWLSAKYSRHFIKERSKEKENREKSMTGTMDFNIQQC